MTVRAWFTISALVLAALAAAFLFQLTRPVPPPEVVVHANGDRLDGALDAACWPQRSGDLRCTRQGGGAERSTIARDGSLRIVLASPAQPRDGSITITDDDGEIVLESDWEREIDYELEPGDHTLTVLAGETGEDSSYVRYVFELSVTRSGS